MIVKADHSCSELIFSTTIKKNSMFPHYRSFTKIAKKTVPPDRKFPLSYFQKTCQLACTSVMRELSEILVCKYFDVVLSIAKFSFKIIIPLSIRWRTLFLAAL